MNSEKLRFLLASSVLFPVVLQGCASMPEPRSQFGTGQPAAPLRPASRLETQELRDIQTLYAKGFLESASQKLTQFEKKYPDSPQLGAVANLRGLILLAYKKPQEAIPFFEQALERPGSAPGFTEYARYNLATALYGAKRFDDAAKAIEELKLDAIDNDTGMKVHVLRAQILQQQNQHLEAAREALTAGRVAKETKLAAERQKRGPLVLALEQSLQKIDNLLALEQLATEATSSPVGDIAITESIKRHAAQGSAEKAASQLETLKENFPSSPLLPQAQAAAQSAAAASPASGSTSQAAQPSGPVGHVGSNRPMIEVPPGDPSVVGVLLPMKGKFAKFGQRNLQAIELAFGIFGSGDRGKITLAVEDSGDDLEQTLAALDRLVAEHRAMVVLGPLLSKGIDQVTARAEELKVPLISLARQTSGAPTEHVIQAGLSMKAQAQEVARHAIEQLKLRRFAIATPRERIGEEAARAFWDTVEELGGEVVGYESYMPGETDFRQVVDRLSGLHYPEARQRELDALAKEREAANIKKRTRRTEQYFALKPIVDYEAVFIPDEPRVAGQLLPTFAYRDVDNVKFLGTSSWNSLELFSRAQLTAERAIFVDAFYPESRRAAPRQFIEQYRGTFGADPSTIEAVAYDAARLLESVLQNGTNPDLKREEVLSALKDAKGLTGATGKLSVSEGQLKRDLTFLTFRGGQIVTAE